MNQHTAYEVTWFIGFFSDTHTHTYTLLLQLLLNLKHYNQYSGQ